MGETSQEPKNLYMLDSGAAISVAPYAEFKNVKLDKSERQNYNLQSATGKKLQIYGTKNVPFMFGDDKIYIKVVICDVKLPLLSTSDMIQNGISVYLDREFPYLQVKGKRYKLILQNKHFWMRKNYQKEGNFGFAHKNYNNYMATLENQGNKGINLINESQKIDNSQSKIEQNVTGIVEKNEKKKKIFPSKNKTESENEIRSDNVPGSSTDVRTSNEKTNEDEIARSIPMEI